MRKVRMNADTITIGDMELFEDITGDDILKALTPVPVLDDEGRMVPDPDPKAKGRPLTEMQVSSRQFRALMYIALLHDDPDLTFDQFKLLRLSDIDFDIEEDDDPKEEKPDSGD
jgi:hypothetical protein